MMNGSRPAGRRMAVLLLVGLAGGCVAGPPMEVGTQPTWAYAPFKTVAVAPFASRVAEAPDAGKRIAADLEAALIANDASHFRVMPWQENQTAAQDRAELLIQGTCLRYETVADIRTQWVSSPSYATRADHEQVLVGEHMMDVEQHRHAATVEVGVRVIESATGKVLHHPEPIVVTAQRRSWLQPPSESTEELAVLAMRVAAHRLLREIDVTRESGRIPHDVLTTNRFVRRGRTSATASFTTFDPRVLVVVRGLPRGFDGRPCRIEITEPDSGRRVALRAFTWSETLGPAGWTGEFAPADLLGDERGIRLRVTLVISDRAVAARDIRISRA